MEMSTVAKRRRQWDKTNFHNGIQYQIPEVPTLASDDPKHSKGARP